MERVAREWEVLQSFLPDGWEDEARKSGAICRTSKVSSAEELLRVELLHFGEGLSLKETSVVAREGKISYISSVALYKTRAKKQRMAAVDMRAYASGVWDTGNATRVVEWAKGTVDRRV